MAKQAEPPSRNRATREALQDRYRDIESLMDKGHKPADIARAISERYDICRRQAERDIKAVKKRRGQNLLSMSESEFRAEHYGQLNEIYKTCVQKEDFQTALKAIELKEKLIDKYPVNRGEKHESISTTPRTLPGDLENLLAELRTDRMGQ